MKSRTKVLLELIFFFLTASCATFQPKLISPEQTASAFESRSLDNINLKEFIQESLHHEITPWPLRSWDFPTRTLAVFYYHPDLDVARTK